MQSKKSPADASKASQGFKVTVTIRDAIEEFRRICKALQDSKPNINPEQLLKADSTEQALKEQSIEDAEIAFISALATAQRESSRVSRASTKHQEGKELPK
ncbi:hypothetical protein [Iningainema tapete]|uniref:Uncharacterized protein n=1 Tax=Iningainema tapete BLCC-T55 TaxID=2748662 RepID=A0A8J6XCN5_9CYAN|nr:hypothetical protein [Iningainema tapete]MBD2770648.1 hypothetical protein [Iningainema tapete BLCC-T55]